MQQSARYRREGRVTRHPLPALVRLVRQHVQMDRLRRVVVARPQRLGQLLHALDRVRLEQVLVVKMVKEDVEPLLRVDDVRFVGRLVYQLGTQSLCHINPLELWT